jgi:putative polyhydroxyalkanoate system protein
MSNIHVKHKHSLSPQEARKRVEEIAKGLKKEYKIDYAWKANRLLFKRSGAVGYVEMGDGFIELKIKLGMVLAPLKGKIEKTIHQNIAAEMSGKSGTKLT